MLYIRALVKSVCQNIIFLFLNKTYVVDTQKNRLNETVLLSTQNMCLNWLVRKYLQFYTRILCVSKPIYTWVLLYYYIY